MNKSIFKGKSTRTKIFSVITVVGILLLLGLNFLLTYFGGTRLFMVDMTREGFYTLSDKMIEVCEEMFTTEEGEDAKEIVITFCTDPDYLTASDTMRATYFMALSLQKKFDNVKVKTVNVALDPTAVSMYKTTSRDTITVSDVIFSYGSKYKIADATGFWTSNNFSYNGEYRVASILASLLAIDRPKAYFVTDNGASYYDASNPDSDMSKNLGHFADLLNERGLEIKTISLYDESIKEIPEDCALLIINDPREDFTIDESKLNSYTYVSPLEKIDKYLRGESGAVMLNKDFRLELPNLEIFCKEWGIGFSRAGEEVYDEDNALFTTLGGESDGELFAGVYDPSEENFGYAYYGKYSTISSSPKMVFSNTGYVYCTMNMSESMMESGNKYGSINYAAFIGTSENAKTKIGSFTEYGERTLVAASVRNNLDDYTAEKTSSYFFCTNSADFFSDKLLSNSSYANYDVLASVVSNISRTDRFATIELGGLSYNSPSFGGKQTSSTELSSSPTKVYSWDASEVVKYNRGLGSGAIAAFTIVVMAVPVAIAAIGIVTFIRRKFL